MTIDNEDSLFEFDMVHQILTIVNKGNTTSQNASPSDLVVDIEDGEIPQLDKVPAQHSHHKTSPTSKKRRDRRKGLPPQFSRKLVSSLGAECADLPVLPFKSSPQKSSPGKHRVIDADEFTLVSSKKTRGWLENQPTSLV